MIIGRGSPAPIGTVPLYQALEKAGGPGSVCPSRTSENA
jgi:thiamine biosynthesis protein ThiC